MLPSKFRVPGFPGKLRGENFVIQISGDALITGGVDRSPKAKGCHQSSLGKNVSERREKIHLRGLVFLNALITGCDFVLWVGWSGVGWENCTVSFLG